jgi:hypothetical protein
VELRASWQRLPLSGLVPQSLKPQSYLVWCLASPPRVRRDFIHKSVRHWARFSKSTVRGAEQIRQKTREMLAEAQEQIQDIVAEADAENNLGPAPSKESRRPDQAKKVPNKGIGTLKLALISWRNAPQYQSQNPSPAQTAGGE